MKAQRVPRWAFAVLGLAVSHNHTKPNPRTSNAARLNWRSFRRYLASQVAADGHVYNATDTLLIENNRHGVERCTGVLKLVDGVPSLSYCGRWHCWKCGDVRLWTERRRLLHGADRIAADGELWFTTVIDSDPRRSVEPIDFQSRLSGLLTAWRKKAQRSGVVLQYAVVYGFKTTGQIHAHILANWLPEPLHAPTSEHEFRHRDAWLDGRAELSTLSMWHELAQSPERVAHYSANNLGSVLHVELPEHFQRLVYSREFPKMPSAAGVPAVTGNAVVDYAIAYFGAVVTEPPYGTVEQPADDQQPIYKDSQTNGNPQPKAPQVDDYTTRSKHRERHARAHFENVRTRGNPHVQKLLGRLSRQRAKTDNTGRRRRTAAETYDITPSTREPP